MSGRRAARTAVSLALSAALGVGGVPAASATSVPPAPAGSHATLAPLEPRAPTQVVVYDRTTRTSRVVSHDQAGRPGTVSSRRPSISADGAFVAFESDAPLVGDDTNDRADVYRWGRDADQIERISVAADGKPSDGASRDPSISGDGGVVAFSSVATNLTADTGFDGRTAQVFAWQAAGGVRLVSVASAAAGTGSSGSASVSQDGRVVAFASAAPDLVTGDGNDARDIFLRDLSRSATIRASVTGEGEEVSDESRRPSLSADGGAVVFDSTSPELDAPDSNGVRDVFVRDLPPAVQVAPNPLDFGVTALGTAATQSVTVVSVGWTPVAMTSSAIAGTHATDFVVADDTCSGGVLAYGASCAIAVLHVPTAAGPRSATLSIVDSALDSPQEVVLAAGVAAAQIRLDPPVGPPGMVTVLSGSDFPPGALVTFTWDRGISQPSDPVVVGPDGTFAVGVLVFHNDRLGPRQLLVSPATGGPSFDARAAPFLVVASPLQPPGTSAVSFAAPDLRLILISR